jgi:hypothetical protein
MTAQQAIERANEMKAGNAVSDELKLEWLTELDQNIYNDCVLTHLHDYFRSNWWYQNDEGKVVFRPAPEYTQDNVGDELIAKAPYDILYVYWLMAKIDLASEEEHRYNVDNNLFETALSKFKNKYHRDHTPVPNMGIKVGVFR